MTFSAYRKRFESLPPWMVAAAAAILYLFVCRRFYVGYFSDDARDILAAHALTMGGYFDLQSPTHPPLNFPLPGFSLLLAPWTLVFFHHPEWLRIVPLLLTLACIGLFNAFLAPWTSPGERSVLGLLFALNPQTVVASGRVTSDACFLAAILTFFVWMQKRIDRFRTRDIAGLGIIAGFAALVRPEGILLLPAAISVFWRANVRRAMIPFLSLALLGFGIFILRNHWAVGHVTGYSSIWQDSLPLLAGRYDSIGHNAFVVARVLVYDLSLGIDTSASGDGASRWLVALSLLPIGFAIVGLCKVLRSSEPQALAVFSLACFSAMYLLLHIAWLAIDPHYFWPLLPFFIFFIAKGLSTTSAGAGRRPVILVCLFSVLSLDAWQYSWALRTTPPSSQSIARPSNTLEWIRLSTPAHAFILAPNAPLVTLYTDRYSLALIGAQDPDEFFYDISKRQMTHVLITPGDFMYVKTLSPRDPTLIWRHIKEWLPAMPGRFQLVFKDDAEQTQLYALRAQPEFMAAYPLYLAARDKLRAGKMAEGLELLDQSMKQVRLPGALNLYAATCLIRNQNLLEGQAMLEEALKDRPDFPLAALNLARIDQRLGQKDKARYYFDMAETLIASHDDLQFLLPTIRQENSQW